jgi:predicted RNA methylase
MGSYDPPFGFVGRRADVLLLHRIAEASIRSFLVRVSRNLERPVRDAPIPAGV